MTAARTIRGPPSPLSTHTTPLRFHHDTIAGMALVRGASRSRAPRLCCCAGLGPSRGGLRSSLRRSSDGSAPCWPSTQTADERDGRGDFGRVEGSGHPAGLHCHFRQAYIATIEREAPHIVGGSPGGGPAYGPNLEHRLAKARDAETPEELWRLVMEAENIASTRIMIARTGALG